MGGDYAKHAKIDMTSEDYLKQLIYLLTGGRRWSRWAARGCSST